MTITTIDGKSLCEALAENYKRTLPKSTGGTKWTGETFARWVKLRYPEITFAPNQEWKGISTKVGGKGINYKYQFICDEHGSYEAEANHILKPYLGNQCKECKHEACRNSTGKVRRSKATKEEIQQAIDLYKELGNKTEVGRRMGRSRDFVRKCLDPAIKQRVAEQSYARYQSPEVKQRAKETYAIRYQTEHGKQSKRQADAKRRALGYEAIFPVFIGENQELEMTNCYEGKHLKGGKGITSFEESLYFLDQQSVEDYAKLRAVADQMEIEYGEKFAIDHLIPLSRGGLHHSSNFHIKTDEANSKKNNKRIVEDDKQFALTIFGTCEGYVSTTPIQVGARADGFLYQAFSIKDLY